MKALARTLSAAALLAACGDNGKPATPDGGVPPDGTPPELNVLPPRITNVVGPTTYDGNADDLLTGGLGKTGIGSNTPPGFADPANPTVAELRRRAIYTNYRGLLDPSAAGGFGTLYGPNVDVNGNATTGEGKIAGKEYLAYADDGTGKKNVGLMVRSPRASTRTTRASSPGRPLVRAASTARSARPASGGSSTAAPSRTPTRGRVTATTTSPPTRSS